jgi:hypothetical protein
MVAAVAPRAVTAYRTGPARRPVAQAQAPPAQVAGIAALALPRYLGVRARLAAIASRRLVI